MSYSCCFHTLVASLLVGRAQECKSNKLTRCLWKNRKISRPLEFIKTLPPLQHSEQGKMKESNIHPVQRLTALRQALETGTGISASGVSTPRAVQAAVSHAHIPNNWLQCLQSFKPSITTQGALSTCKPRCSLRCLASGYANVISSLKASGGHAKGRRGYSARPQNGQRMSDGFPAGGHSSRPPLLSLRSKHQLLAPASAHTVRDGGAAVTALPAVT